MILHVDMDAFYAMVATRDRPDLQGRPVIVGGGGEAGVRGVVLSASYEARARGVASAMPMARARRLCPEAVIVPPDYATFESVSASVMEIFRRVTPVVEPLSLDEAFLDLASMSSTPISGAPIFSAPMSGDPTDASSTRRVAELIRARVADEQRVTCSVGAAPTRSVAKLASRRAKPDGVVVVEPHQVTTFLHPRQVQELWGVGEKTAAQLNRLGLITVGDVAHTPRATLQRALGAHAGAHVHALAWGEDGGTTRRGGFWPTGSSLAPTPDRSMGAQETFGRDTDDPAVIHRELLRLTGRVTARMRAAEVVGRTVTLTVRFADFTTITRSRTMGEASDVTTEVYAAIVRLYAALGLQRARIRLVGVRVENLQPRETCHRQLALDEREHGWSEADRAVDRAAARFGSGSVQPASLIRRRVG